MMLNLVRYSVYSLPFCYFCNYYCILAPLNLIHTRTTSPQNLNVIYVLNSLVFNRDMNHETKHGTYNTILITIKKSMGVTN